MSLVWRILVVEDEPQIRRVLRAMLSAEGYEVWDAQQGEHVLRARPQRTVRSDFVDINLPDMTGIEVCREIRASFSVPIIMLTVRNSETDKVAALDADASDYMTKPFDTSELLARVRTHLRRNRPSSEKVFISDDFVIDFTGKAITRRGRAAPFTEAVSVAAFFLRAPREAAVMLPAKTRHLS